jgi:hypothetical protein
MFLFSVVQHQLVQSECPENGYVIRNHCILRGTPEEACLEFAPELSKLLAQHPTVRSIIDLETLIPTQNLSIPEGADLTMAVNFTRNYVVAEEGQIIEKLSEDTERLIIVIGSVLSIIVLVFSICSRATTGR